MYEYVFYKSFLNHWMAFGVKGHSGEVWYSYDGVRFYPLAVTTNKDKCLLEYLHGPDYWRGTISLESLNVGNLVELSLANYSENKPIFRLQKTITHSLIFDPDPKFRVIHNLYQLVDGRVLCMTAFNGRHYTAETLKLYLLSKIGGEYTLCNTLSFSSNYTLLHTDQGDLNFSTGTWEGYKVTSLKIEDYKFLENETEFFLAKK